MLPVLESTSSSSLNFSLPASMSTIYPLQTCMSSTSGRYTTLGIAITSCLLVLPFCMLVLCHGLQRWQEQHSNKILSNFHVFTYHLAAIEITGIFGYIIIFCGAETNLPLLMEIGNLLCLFTSMGQMFFHFFTILERYLAVIHPITYRTLTEAKVIRIRNVVIGCVLALSFAVPFMSYLSGPVPIVITTLIVMLYFVVFKFLSLSVVCALTDKGPGRDVGTTKRVGPKLRAFYSILIILGVLFLRFVGHLIVVIFFIFSYLGKTGPCAFVLAEFWLGLPCNLVLPLLYLHKAGKLRCCKRHNQSGKCIH